MWGGWDVLVVWLVLPFTWDNSWCIVVTVVFVGRVVVQVMLV